MSELVLKCVLCQQKISDLIEQAKAEFGADFDCDIKNEHGDIKLTLKFSDEAQSKNVTRFLVMGLKEDIYAEKDISPEERLFEVLKFKNKKVSVAESFTGGRVVSAIIKNSGVSNYLHEGIVCYSNQSKMDRLGVKAEDIVRYGAVSSIVAYQMAMGLLKTGKCDLAIATTGIAGPDSDGTDKPVGLCYIAVGTVDAIHTFKYNLTGDREEITEQAKNVALALAINKLKNIK